MDDKTQIPYIVYISIHALVKRATDTYIDKYSKIKISIHALVKRATQKVKQSKKIDYNFNPRPREEGDVTFKISRGVPSDFNPRPREEGDGIEIHPVNFCCYFNPRPREEGDIIFQILYVV